MLVSPLGHAATNHLSHRTLFDVSRTLQFTAGRTPVLGATNHYAWDTLRFTVRHMAVRLQRARVTVGVYPRTRALTFVVLPHGDNPCDRLFSSRGENAARAGEIVAHFALQTPRPPRAKDLHRSDPTPYVRLFGHVLRESLFTFQKVIHRLSTGYMGQNGHFGQLSTGYPQG